MEDTTENTAAKQECKTSESEGQAKEDASPLKPEGPTTSKEPTPKNPKAKKSACKKHAKDSKKKTKKHSKTVEVDSSSDSDDSSSDSSSSSSSDDSSDSSSDEDETARKKRRSKAKKAKKLKAKKKAKAKAKAEDTDSDSDDESSSDEEEKKKSKRKKKMKKKKKRARKSKEVEEEDDEAENDDDEDGNTAFNRQQLAQLQAMNLQRIGRARVVETANGNGELGKKSAKAKGKPGKRSVFRFIQRQISGVPFAVLVYGSYRRLSREQGVCLANIEGIPPFIEENASAAYDYVLHLASWSLSSDGKFCTDR